MVVSINPRLPPVGFGSGNCCVKMLKQRICTFTHKWADLISFTISKCLYPPTFEQEIPSESTVEHALLHFLCHIAIKAFTRRSSSGHLLETHNPEF